MSQSVEGLLLDLARSFASDTHFLADLLQRVILAVLEAETHPENELLAILQTVDRFADCVQDLVVFRRLFWILCRRRRHTITKGIVVVIPYSPVEAHGR